MYCVRALFVDKTGCGGFEAILYVLCYFYISLKLKVLYVKMSEKLFFIYFKKIHVSTQFVCVYMYVGGCVFMSWHMNVPEYDLWKSVLPFHHVEPRDQPQVITLSGQCLYPMSHSARISELVFCCM